MNEPVFTIRAKDALSIPVLQAYMNECEEHGLYDQASQVDLSIIEFRRWQADNINLTKLPDHQHVPA